MEAEREAEWEAEMVNVPETSCDRVENSFSQMAWNPDEVCLVCLFVCLFSLCLEYSFSFLQGMICWRSSSQSDSGSQQVQFFICLLLA